MNNPEVLISSYVEVSLSTSGIGSISGRVVDVVGADEIGVGVRGKVEDGAGADSERSSTVKVGYPI